MENALDVLVRRWMGMWWIRRVRNNTERTADEIIVLNTTGLQQLAAGRRFRCVQGDVAVVLVRGIGEHVVCWKG